MKKFILLIIPILFLGWGSVEASVCAPGTQVTDTVTVDGCDYEVTYDYCVDPNGDIIRTLSSSTPYGSPTCTTEGKDIHYPTGTVGDESACYILYTVCFPE